MSKYYLEIVLLSPLASSGGTGRSGEVDRDLIFDSVGLPVLPGRRLKGLWRDAYKDVFDAWSLCGKTILPPEKIFGLRGQQPGNGAALFCLGNGYLKESNELIPWLLYFQEYSQNSKVKTRIYPDDVVEHFTTIRTQTSIDRYTGTAKDDTLRNFRALHSNLTFCANLHFALNPDDYIIRALALGAASFRYMGTARTRGLGRVNCSLKDQTGRDLTRYYLENLSIENPKGIIQHSSDEIQIQQSQNSLRVSSKETNIPSHLLRYRLKLQSPAIISTLEGDPNTVITQRYIPGSNILGAVAHKYLRKDGHRPQDNIFRLIFLDGVVRFLSAFPESSDEDIMLRQRLIPIPHSIRQKKEDNRLIDYLKVLESDILQNQEQVRRLEKKFASISDREMKIQTVETQFAYHHARASDRRIGRAIGSDIKGGGAIFVYESIQPEQTFQGVILGNQQNLEKLLEWIPNRENFWFGRSRSAQYGGKASLEWIDESPIDISKVESEWFGFMDKDEEVLDEEREEPEETQNTQLVVITLSPIISVNQYGHPAAIFPLDELRERLKLPPDATLNISKSYTRSELIGGYYSHLSLPRQQWPAVSAGSVFVIESNYPIEVNTLCELGRDGLGLRREEGFGRLSINSQINLELLDVLPQYYPKPRRSNMPSSLSEQVKEFLSKLVYRRCECKLHKLSLEIASSISVPNHPSPSLLQRLQLILQQNDNSTALNIIKSLRKPALKQLAKYTLPLPDEWSDTMERPQNLERLLHLIMEKPEQLMESYADEILGSLLGTSFSNEKQDIVEELKRNTEQSVNDFCQTLLSTIRRKICGNKMVGERT